MGAYRSSTYFVAALWAGLAAPVDLFAAPPPYPYYLGSFSVYQNFATAGVHLGQALSYYNGAARRPSPAIAR